MSTSSRKLSATKVPKTREIWLLAFFLSLYSRPVVRGKKVQSAPPIEFGARTTWAKVWKVCYIMLAEERSLSSYANTVRFSRDQADKLLKARVGDTAILRAGWDQEGTDLGRQVMIEFLSRSRENVWEEIWSWMDELEQEKYPLISEWTTALSA